MINNTKIYLSIIGTIFLLSSYFAHAENVIFPPDQITCYTDVSHFPYQNHCEGYSQNDYKIVNADYSIPKNKIVLFFSDAVAPNYSPSDNPEFFYHDLQWNHVIVLSTANSSIRAKLDDPVWVKQGQYLYFCTAKQCPLIKKTNFLAG